MHGPFEHKNKIQKISILTPTFCFVLTSAKLIFSLNKRTALVQLLRGNQLSRPAYPAVLQGRGFASSLSRGAARAFCGEWAQRLQGHLRIQNVWCVDTDIHLHIPSLSISLFQKKKEEEKKRKESLPFHSFQKFRNYGSWHF